MRGRREQCRARSRAVTWSMNSKPLKGGRHPEHSERSRRAARAVDRARDAPGSFVCRPRNATGFLAALGMTLLSTVIGGHPPNHRPRSDVALLAMNYRRRCHSPASPSERAVTARNRAAGEVTKQSPQGRGDCFPHSLASLARGTGPGSALLAVTVAFMGQGEAPPHVDRPGGASTLFP